MSFLSNKYEVVRKCVKGDLLKYLQVTCQVHQECNEFHRPPTNENPFPFGDEQSKNCFSWYGSLHGDSLLVYLNPILSKIVDKKLVETYSYTRTYYKGSILEKHHDRPSCEYSATLCIKKGNIDWPIFFEKENGKVVSIELEEGDLIVYKGDLLDHWREPYEGDKHIQIFLHFVDEGGPYAKTNRFDGRPTLALGSNFRQGIQ